MSGGHWGYRSQHLEDVGTEVARAFEFLAELEHSMDWAISCDSCSACLRLNLFGAVEAFFDGEDVAKIRVRLCERSCEGCLGRKT